MYKSLIKLLTSKAYYSTYKKISPMDIYLIYTFRLFLIGII